MLVALLILSTASLSAALSFALIHADLRAHGLFEDANSDGCPLPSSNTASGMWL